MTGTNHGMTGAVIAVTIHQPAVALPLSFVSHFVCDAIPHFANPKIPFFSKKFNTILISDFVLAVICMIVLAVIFPSKMWLIWACMILAASPDLAWGYYELYEKYLCKKEIKLDFISRFHVWIQWSQTVRGAYVELAWFVSMAGLIFLAK